MFLTQSFLLVLWFYTSEAANDRYYPRYHLAPPFGWMNDPNGFSFFRGEYHLFYQYNPESSLEPGIAHWGHAKSNNLVNWEHLPISMYPNKWYDVSGVFSGSAIVEDDKMYIFYTGNVNHPGEDPDHKQYQALAVSTDGVNVEKYENNPIINGSDHQPNIRDPKVWKHADTYYMVLGNSYNNNTLGRALLYSSKDMMSWNEVAILDKSDGPLGFMWECPDFFKLGPKHVLLFSPQGVEPEGDKYKNLYQTGYITGLFDYKTHNFRPSTEFVELDHGHDFYATQTILDKSNRRIVIAWFDMWELNYPERADGFTGHMTIPRVLHILPSGKIIQQPISEIVLARGRELYSGRAQPKDAVILEDKAGEVRVSAPPTANLELFIESDDDADTVKISYDTKEGKVTLDRGGNDGVRRTDWRPIADLKWRIFIDASSIELFCGEGEVTFSSRFFPKGNIKVRFGEQSQPYKVIINAMKRTIPDMAV